MHVNLFYLTDSRFGGWVTYTSHLMDCLREVGVTPHLYKVRNRTETRSRPFGYDETYRNLSLSDAVSYTKMEPSLVLACGKKYRDQCDVLLKAGSLVTLHDPTELKHLPKDFPGSRTIVNRLTGLQMAPDATLIRHPYVRQVDDVERPRFVRAVSVSRIDFDKHTDIILEANDVLNMGRTIPSDDAVQLYGAENRMYTRLKIQPRWPNWVQNKLEYPRIQNAAFMIMRSAQLMVDMSEIKGDGGGTQYTTLEAWDAGAIPVINKAWLTEEPDDMVPGKNCLVVEDAADLIDVLINTNNCDIGTMRQVGYKQLDRHCPAVVGEKYKALFSR